MISLQLRKQIHSPQQVAGDVLAADKFSLQREKTAREKILHAEGGPAIQCNKHKGELLKEQQISQRIITTTV